MFCCLFPNYKQMQQEKSQDRHPIVPVPKINAKKLFEDGSNDLRGIFCDIHKLGIKKIKEAAEHGHVQANIDLAISLINFDKRNCGCYYSIFSDDSNLQEISKTAESLNSTIQKTATIYLERAARILSVDNPISQNHQQQLMLIRQCENSLKNKSQKDPSELITSWKREEIRLENGRQEQLRIEALRAKLMEKHSEIDRLVQTYTHDMCSFGATVQFVDECASHSEAVTTLVDSLVDPQYANLLTRYEKDKYWRVLFDYYRTHTATENNRKDCVEPLLTKVTQFARHQPVKSTERATRWNYFLTDEAKYKINELKKELKQKEHVSLYGNRLKRIEALVRSFESNIKGRQLAEYCQMQMSIPPITLDSLDDEYYILSGTSLYDVRICESLDKEKAAEKERADKKRQEEINQERLIREQDARQQYEYSKPLLTPWNAGPKE